MDKLFLFVIAIIFIYYIIKFIKRITDLYLRAQLEKECTTSIIGEIVKNETKWRDDYIEVEYVVNKQIYHISERVRVHHEKVISNNIIMYRITLPVLEKIAIGTKVGVSYNPKNPSRAFITNNVSFF